MPQEGLIRAGLILALPLALAACGQSEPAPEPVPEGSSTPINPAAAAKIVVEADGATTRDGKTLRFGALRDQVDEAVERAFGAAPALSSNPECGAGPMDFSQFGPLQLAYSEGRFAGWFLREGADVATSDGVAPGVTDLDALKRERKVRALDTTLEGEFEYTTADYGTITGFADPDGAITGLAAGVTCFFR